VSEGAGSAKCVWFMFGAKPAQSETPARAAAKRRPLVRGHSGKKDAKLPKNKVGLGAFYRTSSQLAIWQRDLRGAPEPSFFGSNEAFVEVVQPIAECGKECLR
jgi:hypothetical protein